MVSLLFIYILLSYKPEMIDQDLQKKSLDALNRLIIRQLSQEITKSIDLNESEVIESVYQKIVVEALLGQEQVRKLFLMLHQSRNCFIQPEKIGQSMLFQWITSKQMTREYAKLTSASMYEQTPVLWQVDAKEEQPYHEIWNNSSTPLQIQNNNVLIQKQSVDFPFINEERQGYAQDNFNISDIIGSHSARQQYSNQNSLDNRQIMFYTDEQMMDQLKLELQATPAKTVGSTKMHHLDEHPQQDIKVQNVDQIGHQSPAEELFIPFYQQIPLCDGDRVIKESQEYGHFLNGDKIEKIIDIFYYKDQQYVTIKWQPRSNGQQPRNSTLPSQIVRYHCPHGLLTFYEKRFPTLTL